MVKEGYSLLVRNLRYETSPEKIEQTFEQYGKVRDVYLPLDYHTRKPRGFGFVEFYHENDARDALEALDRTYIDGNQVAVVIAQDRRKSPETMRKVQRYQSEKGRRGRDDYRRDDYRRDHYRRDDYRRDDSRREDIRRHRSRSRSRGSLYRTKRRNASRSPSADDGYVSESPSQYRDRHGSPKYASYRTSQKEVRGQSESRRLPVNEHNGREDSD